MGDEEFMAYMKKAKRPANTIKGYVRSLEFYVNFLQSHRQVRTPDEAGPIDLKAFVSWGIERGENIYRHLWGIRIYYEFRQLEIMEKTVRKWMEYVQNATRKLREFPKVDQDSVKKLSAIGIKTVNQLLRAGNSPEKRAALSEKTGASQDVLLELFKLSNLSRLPGLKKVRGRLFYEAGLDTFASIAVLEPEEVCAILQEYIEKTGFDGSAPTPNEAQVTVTMAKFLPENLE
jgi:hypothetical protein